MKRIFALIALSAFLITGCSNTSNTNVSEKTPPTNKIRIAGSSTVLPILTLASEQFHKDNPEIILQVQAGGSGVGAKSVLENQVEIGMMSRDLSEEEKNSFNEKYEVTAVGIDAVAAVVSSEVYNEGVTKLSKEDLQKIYSGQETNWQAFGGPDRQILVIDKEPSRGTRHVFMQYVFGNSKAQAAGAIEISGSNNEEQTKIAQSDSAIGMLSLAWMNEDVKGITIVENNTEIAPTLENITNGSFPIRRNLNIIYKKSTVNNSKSVEEFINYVLSPEGQTFVEESGYIKIQE